MAIKNIVLNVFCPSNLNEYEEYKFRGFTFDLQDSSSVSVTVFVIH